MVNVRIENYLIWKLNWIIHSSLWESNVGSVYRISFLSILRSNASISNRCMVENIHLFYKSHHLFNVTSGCIYEVNFNFDSRKRLEVISARNYGVHTLNLQISICLLVPIPWFPAASLLHFFYHYINVSPINAKLASALYRELLQSHTSSSPWLRVGTYISIAVLWKRLFYLCYRIPQSFQSKEPIILIIIILVCYPGVELLFLRYPI